MAFIAPAMSSCTEMNGSFAADANASVGVPGVKSPCCRAVSTRMNSGSPG